MEIAKGHWGVEGDTLRLSMPLQKVDKKRRIVSGFATLDNPDTQGDVVTKEASAKAFSRFRGNIRLMHQPIPAGRLVNFREEEFFDQKTNKIYNGIYVDAYVSEGAEDIWKMVLDGTLTGFSIGGSVIDASTEFVKDAGRTVRFIKDYEMVELSLVDNPANQLSNIFSIQKSADGQDELGGMLAKVSVENVFYCKSGHDPVALVGTEEKKDCLECGADMKNIGWFESDGGDKAEKVNAIIEKFEATEGGENMPQEEKETDVATEETPEVTEEVTEEETEEADETAEEAPVETEETPAEVTVTGTGEAKTEEAKQLNEETKIEEGTVDENPLTKMFDELQANITKALEATSAEVKAANAGFEAKLEELAKKHDELSTKFGTLTEKYASVEEKLTAVEKSGAVKKSADLGGDAEDSSIKKSSDKGVWRGSIFSMDSI